jgi:prepilin peptidase CpaA
LFGVLKLVWTLLLLLGAIAMDLKDRRIWNGLICLGMVTGLCFRFWESGVTGLLEGVLHLLIPILLFFLLFLIRALGAGDIKLFSMIASIWNVRLLFWCMVSSFVIGAVIAMGKMLFCKNFFKRIHYFFDYLNKVIHEGSLSVYDSPSKEENNFIHFSIPIGIGFLAAYLISNFTRIHF